MDLLAATITVVVLYLFLGVLFPYHLAHKAQFSLLPDWTVSPIVLSLLLTGSGIVLHIILRQFRIPRWISYSLTVFCIAVTACHLCDLRDKWFHLPSMKEEELLAIDTEAYLGNWQKVQQLTYDCDYSDFRVYYHNLSLAHQGLLADSLLHHNAPFEYALFYPFDENGNYMTISAASEVWWFVKDLTMAEHATMLSMTFSPMHAGRRPLERLYQINVASGNDRSAEKYARILKSNGHTLPDVQYLPIEQPQQDTLRLSFQYGNILRSTLDRLPKYRPTLEYLLCYDLLTKDLSSFRKDIEQYGITHSSKVYQEAMLILMSMHPELRDPWHDYIPAEVYQEFCRFNEGMNKHRKAAQMQEFRHTYWYYHQFITLEDNSK